MTSNQGASIPVDIAVVVFGIGNDKKPRAARFPIALSERAMRAAEIMSLRSVAVTTDEQRALAAKLPRGRILPTGRAVVPHIRPACLQNGSP